MAAERLDLLEKAVKVMTSMADSETLLKIQSQVASELLELYYIGQLPKADVLKAIIRSFEIVNTAVNTMEAKIVKERAKELGFESLTTDTSGVRTAEWFRKSGLAFATGEASSGITCAIINPAVGMAASHLNSVTIPDYEKFVERALVDPRIWFQATPGNPFGSLVSPKSLMGTVEQTVNLAYTKFSEMTPRGFPEEGSMFALTGLDYLKGNQLMAIKQYALLTFRNNIGSEGKKVGSLKNVGVQLNWLGSPGGVIYGGPYQEPARYNISLGE